MLEFTKGAREVWEYYNGDAPDIESLKQDIADYCEKNAEKPPCVLKSRIHRIIAENAQVKVFENFPFFWETAVGRSRYNWGTDSPLGGYLQRTRFNPNMQEPYRRKIAPYTDSGLMWGWSPVGYDHHCPGYDNILRGGLRGIVTEAEKRLAAARNQAEHDFLESVIISNKAVMRLAERFANEAADVGNLRNLAEIARRVPANPAGTFHEALACILFMRETIGSLESFGVSTFGHLDRMLYPYYEKDLREGNITREEAKSLVHALLAFTDAKFDLNDAHFAETSTTIVIGGCDAEGNTVFNEITCMVAEACMENQYIGTKIIARISSGHPKEYFTLLGSFAASRTNILVMPNDDTLIAANRRWNKHLEDCRLYVGGGCHEIVLAGTEVNTRADTWVNIPGVLMRTLFPDSRTPEIGSGENAPDFEAFYRVCMRNLRGLHDFITGAKEEYERLWRDNDAAPFYSSTMADCIENARDITAGGARYNSVSLSMVGAATFIDSLYALKTLVFDAKSLTLAQFREILSQNYEGNEPLRLSIQKKLPRHGQGGVSDDFNDFAAMVMRDLSRMAGQPNGRGGIVTPAFYPHDLFIMLGHATMATPDGRKAGSYLSRGFSPSESTPVDGVTAVINSLKNFDMTLFPESFATELTLPATPGSRYDPEIIAGLIAVFAKSGGSTLQINVLDHEELLKAKAEPAKYPNLIVRICGYSQTFNSLSGEKKDELINRTMRYV